MVEALRRDSVVIVERSMHESYLSNAYLVADEASRTGVAIDSGAPIEPILERADELGLRITHVLNTHEHHDHTIHNIELQERFDAQLVLPDDLDDGEIIATGGLRIRALHTPGHTEQHVAFVVDDHAVFTGDVLFRNSVGGTMGGGPDGFSQLRHSVMDVLMVLPHDLRVLPGHTDATTIGAEWEHNPFVRMWRGLDPEGSEAVEVAGHPATLLLETRDYDGGRKAWVRFEDGREAVVGGSMLRRAGATA